MAIYIFIAYALGPWTNGSRAWGRRNEESASKMLMGRIFNGATFSGSAMLLLGITDHSLMALIGSTKPFLAISGAFGFLYSLHALFPFD